MSESRYFEVWAANDANRIDEVRKASGMPVVGIADDRIGGIIGYVTDSAASLVLRALNRPEQG